MRTFLNAIKDRPHAEERPKGASRSTPDVDAAFLIVSACLYILRCADGSLYAGTTRDSLEKRIAEHQAGTFDGYTSRRRPVVLVFHQQFQRVEDAISAERQIKGWRREKKEALIRGDYAALPALARRGSSTRLASPGSGHLDKDCS
jgi:putative endonuclease